MVDALRFALSEPAQPVEAVDEGFAQMIEYHERIGRHAHENGESAQAAMHETYADLLRAALAHPRPTGLPSDRETQDQLAAVLLQHGTEDQKREALAYASGALPVPTVEQAGEVVNHHGALDIQTFARAYKAEVPHAELTVHGISAGLAALEDSGYAQPRPVGVPDGYRPTDDEVRAWLFRHDLADSYIDQWRCAIDDARSMHLLASTPAHEVPHE